MSKSSSTRSRSSGNSSSKSVSSNDSESNVKKMKEKHKKTHKDLETLEEKHQQVLKMHVELRQKFDGIEIQFKENIKELNFYKNRVLASQIQPQNTITYDKQYLLKQIQSRHNLKRSRPNDDANFENVLAAHIESTPFTVFDPEFPSLPPLQEIRPTDMNIRKHNNSGSLSLSLTYDKHMSKSATTEPKASTNNQTQPLSNEAPSTSATANTRNDNIKNKVRAPSPIVSYNLNTKSAYARFSELLGHSNFEFDGPHGRCTYIRTRTRTDYDIIAAEAGLEHHRFTPREDRIINLILLHMCPSYDEKDVFDGINDLKLDITIHKVMKHETEKSKREKRSLNSWLVQLAPGSNVTALLKVKKLLGQSIIRFERRRNSGVIHCKNCQNFEHTANNCSHPFRCVNSKVTHSPGECPTDAVDATSTRNQPACVNCGGDDHPANFRGCLAYKALIKRKQERIQQQQQRQHEHPPAINTQV